MIIFINLNIVFYSLQVSCEKSYRHLISQLNLENKKIEKSNLILADFEACKRRQTTDNAELLQQLQELENATNMMVRVNSGLSSTLEEQKRMVEDESKERICLLGKYRNIEHEVDKLKENLEEEVSSKENFERQLLKNQSEADTWRNKYEVEAVAKAEELEMSKLKVQGRLSESQNTIEHLNSKLIQLENAKSKLTDDLKEMSIQLDQAQILNTSMEKKAKQFDRIVSEWKVKVGGLSVELDVAQNETRNASSELFSLKNAYDESIHQLDEVRRENKNLCTEIKDIMDQISEGGRSIHEIDKIRKRLEGEKIELETALCEAEGALEHEENKVLRAQLELTQVKQEIERRLEEKDLEFSLTKKTFANEIDGMQKALETETKNKVEAFRMKKRLETDVCDLDSALEHANAANIENQKTIKGIQLQLRNVQTQLEEESRAKEVARDNLLVADRKGHANQNALEEARTLLDQTERNRRLTEQELADTNETLGELTCTNQALTAAKQKYENEMISLHVCI